MLVELDLVTGEARQVASHTSPPDALPPPEAHPNVLFKAGHLEGDTLWACTQTEVLALRRGTWEVVARWSLPCFNDVHHVRPLPDGRLGVVSTGLDAVALVDPETGAFELRGVLGQDPPPKWDPAVDFRHVPTTKPHASHPNHLFVWEGRTYVTRFEQRDAVCLDDPSRRVEVGVQRPHDGLVWDGSAWFTTVDGHVVRSSLTTGRVEEVHDLNALCGRGEPLGWCRGLCPLGGGRFAVGFSALRATRIQANLRWVARKLGQRTSTSLPARVAVVDLAAGRLEAEHFTHEAGLDAMFSLHVLG